MPGGHIISASILAADFTRLGEVLRETEAAGANWIHLDVMDGHFVPNLTMGPFIVEACRRVTDLPLDVHLMVESPEGLLPAFAQAGATWLTVHVEACLHIHKTLEAIQELGVKAGVALNPGTPAAAISEVLPLVDLILVMSVDPGFAGGKYIPTVVDKIRLIRKWHDEEKTRGLISVDGGISVETALSVSRAGAEVLVAASAIFKHPQGIRAGVEALQASLQATPA